MMCCKRPRGFTLIELLVVIAITALLIGILLPAIGRSKKLAQMIHCQANLRSIMLGVGLYCNENKDSLPLPNWADPKTNKKPGWLYNPDPTTPSGNTKWMDLTITGDPAKNYIKLYETGSLWKHLEAKQVYRCIGHKDPYTKNSGWATSFLMNGAIVDYGKRAVARRISEFDSQAVTFWEGDEVNGSWNDGSSYPDEDKSTARHDNGATVASFDGHVWWLGRTNYELELKKTPGKLWCVPKGNGK